MHRRQFLKLAGTLAPTVFWPFSITVEARSKLKRRVRPSDPAWPSAAQWEKLNQAVGGNLLNPQALFAPCSSDARRVACTDVLRNLHNPFYISDQAVGTEVSGWLDAWSPAASTYAVAARNALDVAAGVNFAREHNLRLVVKGTGHSYLGTSNAPDSLLIWTHHMNQVTLHEAFIPRGCRQPPQPAVSAGSGAMWIDLYDAVTTKSGRYVQGGGCTSVGVAGLIQSGGFGSFSKGFGTAAAGLLEAEVVTADGQVRMANPWSNPDLFWALKGGGGGSWGVVTRVTLRTHDLPEFFGWAAGTIKANSDEAFRKLIARTMEFYRDKLFNAHWGEQLRFAPDNTLELNMVSQGLTEDEITRLWQPYFGSVRNTKEFTSSDLEAGAMHARHWWDVIYKKSYGSTSMISDPRPGAPEYRAWWSGDQAQVGTFLHGYDSLWLPASLLQNAQFNRLVEALFAASRYKKVELHLNKGLAAAAPEAIAATRDTATNPKVTEAFTLVIIADGERSAYPREIRPTMDLDAAHQDARNIDLATAELRKIAPNSGSYVSESNFFNKAWQQEYWGTNYPKLRTIKDKYDPDGLFFVHHGVGSEDWSDDGFKRIGVTHH
jgi:FAD/FMN-containing dehydrogenase